MAVRANQLVNFKGQPYVTEDYVKNGYLAALSVPPEAEEGAPAFFYYIGESDGDFKKGHIYHLVVDTSVEPAVYSYEDQGGDSNELLGEDGNLKPEYNPTRILSMENQNGKTEDGSGDDFDYNKIKFIGNCKVNYKSNGMIEIRIGDNLNCSTFGTKDGISDATVTSAKSGDSTGYPSADYGSDEVSSSANGSTQYNIFQSGDKITANCGTLASTADGSTDGTNGNEVHFNDNVNGNFKVYINEGKDLENTPWEIGPITGNGTYTTSMANVSGITGIKCIVTNFGEEPKKEKGATGYSGCVNFTITPAELYDTSRDFQLVKIEMCEGTEVVGEWVNATTNGTYFYLKETDKPGTPAGADYTIAPVTESESGVTLLTTASKVTPSATGMKNIGYPAYVSNKVNCAPNGGTWFTAFNDTSSDAFATWTTEQDASMDWTASVAKNLNAGTFDNPQVSVYGINYNGNGNAVTSAKSNNKMWVKGAGNTGSMADNRWKSDFSGKQDFANIDLSAEGNTDLQVYQGLLQYPSIDYSSYNVMANVTNPDYSSCDGDRYYYMKFSKPGSMPNGQIDVVAVSDITSALSSGDLQFQIAKDESMSTLYNVVFNYNGGGIAGSNSTFGSTCALKYTFGDGAANDYIWLKITMKKGCTAQIKSVLLNGSTLA